MSKKPETKEEKSKWCAENGCDVKDFNDAWNARVEMLKSFEGRVHSVPVKLLKKWGKHRARKFGKFGNPARRSANVNSRHYNWER